VHHPPEEVAKFGYRSEKNLENLKNHTLYFGDLLELNCLNLMISKKNNFSKSGEFGAFLSEKFLSEKRDLCISHDVFWSSSDEKFGQEKNTNVKYIISCKIYFLLELNHVEFNMNMVSTIHV